MLIVSEVLYNYTYECGTSIKYIIACLFLYYTPCHRSVYMHSGTLEVSHHYILYMNVYSPYYIHAWYSIILYYVFVCVCIRMYVSVN